MIKTVGIVSLSRGLLGEPFIGFEEEIGLRRLAEYGLQVKIMPNARRGLDYLREHPEKRAEDLLTALGDPEIDMILCAIGGDDTYRLLPYLFDRDELRRAAEGTDKVFLGFSDTTVNHFMLHKAGLRTFYGQAFLPDVCEIGPDMLPYTKSYFEELLTAGTIRQIRPSPLWYESRRDYSSGQVGVPLPSHPGRGFRLLQGPARFSGKILGGCLDSMYDFFDGERYADMPLLCEKYGLFPSPEDWKGRILLLETSEELMSPEKYAAALRYLKDAGVFEAVSGVLVGKPADGIHEREYEQALKDVIARPELPIVCDLNVGHAQPRCIVPFGVDARVDAEEQVIRFDG